MRIDTSEANPVPEQVTYSPPWFIEIYRAGNSPPIYKRDLNANEVQIATKGLALSNIITMQS